MRLVRLPHRIELRPTHSGQLAGFRHILELGRHRENTDPGSDQLLATAHGTKPPVEEG